MSHQEAEDEDVDVGGLFADATAATDQASPSTDKNPRGESIAAAAESFADFEINFPLVAGSAKGDDELNPQQRAPRSLKLTRCNTRFSLWGNDLWNAARYVVDRIAAGTLSVKGKTVLELGAGLGAPSIAAALSGARRVVATDYPDENQLELLRRNVKQNDPRQTISNGNVSSGGTTVGGSDERAEDTEAASEPIVKGPSAAYPVDVQGLMWGREDEQQRVLEVTGGSGYDVLLLCDVIFNHACHKELLQTVSRCLSKEHTSVCYCVFTHYLPHRMALDMKFFDHCEAHGLSSKWIEDVKLPVMFPNDRGPEEVRSTVHCYEIRHVFDAAGPPLDETKFDIVVQGTGLTESLLSAGCARSGLKVLHLDASDNYGGAFATFDPSRFVKHVMASPSIEHPNESSCITNAAIRIDKFNSAEEEVMVKQRREFLLDVLPLFFMSNSLMVETLMESNTAKYVEFQNVDRLMLLEPRQSATTNDRDSDEQQQSHNSKCELQLSRVPLSRADAFKFFKWLSPMQIRSLMRFVQDVETAGNSGRDAKSESDRVHLTPPSTAASSSSSPTLLDEMRKKYKLSDRVIDILTLYGSVVDPSRVDVAKGLASIFQYLTSVGRFGGKTPFVVAQCGCSEVPQNLCRVSAVWGTTFVLRRWVMRASKIDNSDFNRCSLTLSNGQVIDAKYFALPQGSWRMKATMGCTKDKSGVEEQQLSSPSLTRLIIVSKRPFVSWANLEAICGDEADDEEEAAQRASWVVPSAFGVIPLPSNGSVNDSPARVVQFVQLGSTTQNTPQGAYSILHFTADASAVSQSAIDSFVDSYICQPHQASSSPQSAPPPASEEQPLTASSADSPPPVESSSGSTPSASSTLQRLSHDEVVFRCSFTLSATGIANSSCSGKLVEIEGNSKSEEHDDNGLLLPRNVIPLACLLPGLDCSSYCVEAHRAFDIATENDLLEERRRAAQAATAAVSEDGAAAPPPPPPLPAAVPFLDFIPDHISQIDMTDHDAEAQILGVANEL